MTKIMAWPSLHNIKRAKRQIIGSLELQEKVSEEIPKKKQTNLIFFPPLSNVCCCYLVLTFESSIVSEIQYLVTCIVF